MSNSTSERIQQAEELADNGDYRQAVELLENVIDSGDAPASAVAMYGDYLRLREQCTYAELMERDPHPSVVLAYAKSLRGNRQLEFLNRVLAEEQPEKNRVQLRLLRFKNALDVGDNVAVEDFTSIWEFSKRSHAARRIRRPLLLAVAKSSNSDGISVLRQIGGSLSLPVAVEEFLKQSVRQLEWLKLATQAKDERTSARVVSAYDPAGQRSLKRGAAADARQRWGEVVARR